MQLGDPGLQRHPPTLSLFSPETSQPLSPTWARVHVAQGSPGWSDAGPCCGLLRGLERLRVRASGCLSCDFPAGAGGRLTRGTRDPPGLRVGERLPPPTSPVKQVYERRLLEGGHGCKEGVKSRLVPGGEGTAHQLTLCPSLRRALLVQKVLRDPQ